MCGIAGFFRAQGGEPDADVLARMTATLAHRGPDDDGFLVAPGVGLGFRRLSIVDLAGGHQPMATEDGALHLIFNGELYNHREIRARLEERGHRYRTQADSETVLHAYAEWGPDCLQRFQGMFSFAIADTRHRRLFAARDRLGIKPFHYAEVGDTVVFGSEIKALLAHPDVPREADREAAALFLTYRYLPSPHTLFRGIRKLPPGHRLLADEHGVRVERWWDVDLTPPAAPVTDAAERLEELLTQSIRARLMADVPLGAMLSGGLDSSILVALMARLHDGPVKTFSIGFRGAEGNEAELPHARRMAEHVGSEHHELVMAEDELPSLILPLIWHMDEPLVEPAAIPVYLVSKLARETVTVALTGEGADELFAGYPKYSRDPWADRYAGLPGFLRGAAHRGLDALPGEHRRLRIAERSLGIRDEAERYASWFGAFAGADRTAILDPELRRSLGDPSARGPIATWLPRAAHRDRLTRMLYADVKTWLADDLLMKMDRMSMATSLEARVPFLDHRVVDFAFTLPASAKLRNGTGKALLRDTFGGLLPPELRERPKAGFPVPIHTWFRGPLRGFLEDTLLSDSLARRGVVDPAAVRRTVEDHVSGRRDRRKELWTLLNLELWYRLFLDPTSPPLTAPAPLSLGVRG